MPTSTSGPTIPATGNTGDIFKKTSGEDLGLYYCVAPNVWRFVGRSAADNFDSTVFFRGDGTWAVPPGSSSIPTGSVHFWTTDTAPTGYLLCDGAAVSRTTFSALFAVISTIYGSGDGSTTFNVPNIKGRAIVGFDASQTEFDALAETGGAKTVTLDSTMIPSHTHTPTDPGHNHTQNSHNHIQDSHNHTQNSFAPRIVNSGTAGTVGVQGASTASNANASNAATTATNQATTATNQAATATNNSSTTGITIGNTGGGLAHNNLQPYLVLNGIIKT